MAIPQYFGQVQQGPPPTIQAPPINVPPDTMPSQPSQAIESQDATAPLDPGAQAGIPDLYTNNPARLAGQAQMDNDPFVRAERKLLKERFHIDTERKQALQEAEAPAVDEHDKTADQIYQTAMRLIGNGRLSFNGAQRREQGYKLLKWAQDQYDKKGEDGLKLFPVLGDLSKREQTATDGYRKDINDADKSEARLQRLDDAQKRLTIMQHAEDRNTVNGASLRNHRVFMEQILGQMAPAQRKKAILEAQKMGIDLETERPLRQAELVEKRQAPMIHVYNAVSSRAGATGQMPVLQAPPPAKDLRNPPPSLTGPVMQLPNGTVVPATETPKFQQQTQHQGIQDESIKATIAGKTIKNEADVAALSKKNTRLLESNPEWKTAEYWDAHEEQWQAIREKRPELAAMIKAAYKASHKR